MDTLPVNIRSLKSTDSFKQQLKTRLFRLTLLLICLVWIYLFSNFFNAFLFLIVKTPFGYGIISLKTPLSIYKPSLQTCNLQRTSTSFVRRCYMPCSCAGVQVRANMPTGVVPDISLTCWGFKKRPGNYEIHVGPKILILKRKSSKFV